MVQLWSDVPLPFTSLTMYLCYEESLINQIPQKQTLSAVGCDELLKQDNPGRVVRLCLERCRHSASWVEECFCEGLTVQPGLKSQHLMTEAFILVKSKSLVYLERMAVTGVREVSDALEL